MRVINTLGVSSNNIKNCVSDDVLRPVMTGVYFDLENKCMVCTDSHILMIFPIEIRWNKEELLLTEAEKIEILRKNSEIVPIEFFDKKKYMGDYKKYKGEISYDFSGSEYAEVLHGEERVFRCRYIDGVFPNYKAVFPQGQPTPIEKIGMHFKFLERINKCLPIPSNQKSFFFSFYGKNKPIYFENKNYDVKGILMPVIGEI